MKKAEKGNILNKSNNEIMKGEREMGNYLLRNEFDKLFGLQLSRLQRHCPGNVLDILENQKETVFEEVSSMQIGENNVPFLPVIPKLYYGIYGLMAMLTEWNCPGFSDIDDPSLLYDVVYDVKEIPQTPYYIFDVNKGLHLEPNPDHVIEIIRKEDRLRVTDAEAIALCLHARRLINKEPVFILGTYYEKEEGRLLAPMILFEEEKGPKLTLGSYGSTYSGCAFPSCGSRGI